MSISDFLKTAQHFFVKYQQLITYVAIGLLGIVFDTATFVILYRFAGINYMIANFTAMSVGICHNFLMNAFFNFKKTDKLHIRFLSFYGIGLVGVAISEIILFIFHDKLGIQAEIVKIASLPFIALFQFSLNKAISFRHHEVK